MMYAKTIEGSTAVCATQVDDSWEAITSLPEGRTFRNAWVLVDGAVVEDLTKSKEIAHEMRRAKRDEAYKPIDGGSPYVAVDETGEAKRLEVKTPDDEMQVAVDACASVEELYALISIEGQL